MTVLLFSVSQDIRDTATVIFLVVPLTLLWVVSIGDALLRRDLSKKHKALWLVGLIPFPIIGTMLYVFRRPGLRQRASTIRNQRPIMETRQMASNTLDDFAVTMDLAQLTLSQTAELLDEVIHTMSEAGSTAGFSLPLTRIRPLGPFGDRLDRLVTQLRMLRFSLARMSTALGTNAGDLRKFSQTIERLGRHMDEEAASSTEVDPLAPLPDGQVPADTVPDGVVQAAGEYENNQNEATAPSTQLGGARSQS
jgi:hypothetical protein